MTEPKTYIGPFGIRFIKGTLRKYKPPKQPALKPPKPDRPPKPPKPARAERPKRANAHIEIPGWDDIRTKTLERDGYTCQECASTSNLTVHHKDRDRKNNEDENLVTLCWNCHKRKHWRIK